MATPTVGADIAQLGQVMQQVGNAVEDERNDRLLQRAQIDMMDGFNQMRLDLDQIGDPDQLQNEFTRRAGELRAGILGNLPERVQEPAGLRFDDLNARQSYAVGRQALERIQSERAAMLPYARDVTMAGAAVGDPETSAVNEAQYWEILERAVEGNLLTPEQAHAQFRSWQEGVSLSRATALLRDNPQGLLSALDGNEFDALDPQAREQWRTRATAALSTRTDAQIAAQNAELREVTEALRQGYPHARAEALAADPAIADLERGPEFLDMYALRQSQPELATATPAEGRAILAEARTRTLEPGESHIPRRDDVLEQVVETNNERWTTDPVAHAYRLDLFAERVEMPDPVSAPVEDINAAIRTRALQARGLTARGYIENPVLFTPEERARWQESAGVMADPGVRTRIATAFVQAGLTAPGEPDTRALARDLFPDDRVFGFTSEAMTNGLNPVIAQQVFRGQQAIELNEVPMPTRVRINDRYQADFGPVLELVDGATLREDVRSAATSLAAYRLLGRSEDVDDSTLRAVFNQSLHEVIGGSGSYGDRSSTGGVHPVNGLPTVIPPGVPGAAVAGTMQGFIDEATRRYVRDSYLYTDEETDAWVTGFWQGASVSGNPPDIGGEMPGGETLRRLRLMASNDSSYLLVFTPRNGPPEVVTEQDGVTPFRIDPRRMLELRP
ncbi:hypothetical protein [Pararhodobacter sp.]|uniref:hypothetical protein n=1 Tax=Pararhodobacter sp. TaxID=2127056 RepID=UPI002FDE6961